jgi:hypothetical protein
VKAFLLSLLLLCGLVLSVQAAPGPDRPTVTTQANRPALQPNRSPVVSGEHTITLIASARGQTPFTFQWYKDNVAIPNATGTSLTIKVSSVGVYYVKVTNKVGSANGEPVTVTNSNGKVQVTF